MKNVSLEDFQKLDIRIGTVIKAEVPQWSHWVMKLTVDIGESKPRTIFAGIMNFFKPESLEGKQFPFVVNLEPKKIGPDKEPSEGMMIMVVPKDDEKTAPILIQLQEVVPNGAKVC